MALVSDHHRAADVLRDRSRPAAAGHRPRDASAQVCGSCASRYPPLPACRCCTASIPPHPGPLIAIQAVCTPSSASTLALGIAGRRSPPSSSAARSSRDPHRRAGSRSVSPPTRAVIDINRDDHDADRQLAPDVKRPAVLCLSRSFTIIFPVLSHAAEARLPTSSGPTTRTHPKCGSFSTSSASRSWL